MILFYDKSSNLRCQNVLPVCPTMATAVAGALIMDAMYTGRQMASCLLPGLLKPDNTTRTIQFLSRAVKTHRWSSPSEVLSLVLQSLQNI